MPLPTDAELIARAQSGDVEAFGELYERYLDPIFRYVRLRLGDERAAEDLTEMVFVRSFENLYRYRERGLPFSSFLYQVARNLLVDHFRRQPPEISLEDLPGEMPGAPALDEKIIWRDEVRAVEYALAQLPPDYQEVIRLRVVLGVPTASVATYMGRSEGAVRVLLTRALRSLRERLEPMP